MNVSSRHRGKWHASAIFIAGLVTATIAFELLLSIIEVTPLWKVLPVAEVSIYGADPYTGYTIRPGVSGIWSTENRSRIQTSLQGLRDRETSYAKADGCIRIALAGDSITEALQVDAGEVFADLLENRLSTKQRSVEVVNLGMSGALPTVQEARMENMGTRFGPDLLVYMINISDFTSPMLREDSVSPGYHKGKDGQWHLSYSFRNTPGYRFRCSWIGQTYYWLLDHSRVMRIINSRRNHGFGNIRPEGDADDSPRYAASHSNTASNVATDLETPWSAPEVRGVLDGFLRDAAATASRVGGRAVLAVRGLVPLSDDEVRTGMEKNLKTHIAAFGIELIDMDAAIAKAMKESDMGDDVNILYGFGAHIGYGHLNRRGHEIYSHALAAGIAPLIKRIN